VLCCGINNEKLLEDEIIVVDEIVLVNEVDVILLKCKNRHISRVF
jgi:hypothetical protein